MQLAKSSSRSGKAKKTSAGARRSPAKTPGTVDELLKSPLAREAATVGVATAVATTMATAKARKAAREEVAAGGIGTSPGAILGSAVATVASEAIQQLVKKSAKPESPPRKAGGAGQSRTKASGSEKSASKPKRQTARPKTKN
jgi:hypothetical protein